MAAGVPAGVRWGIIEYRWCREGWSATAGLFTFRRDVMRQDRARKEDRRSLDQRRQRIEARILDLEQAVAASGTDASALEALGTAREELAGVLAALRGLNHGEEHDPTRVEMGDTVTVREGGSSDAHRYTIVGPVEARVDRSWISADSPLGSALLGHRAGDAVTVHAPGGTVRYILLSIDRS
jgi:transcription elongation GreA/GreB family factor